MPRTPVAILGALALVIVACPAAAQSGRQATKTAIEQIKEQGALPLDQIARISVVDGALVAELAPDAPTQVDALRYTVEGGGGDTTWVVRKRALGGPDNPLYTTVTRYDFDAPADQFWSASVSTRPGTVSLIALTGDTTTGLRVRLTQGTSSISFSCHSATPGGQQALVFQAQAASFQQLQAEHPDETRAYLAPVFRALTGRFLARPGAADVYRAFPEIAPDPAVVRALDQIAARLDADVYREREAAQRELAALGPAGVLAAVRRDNADLGAEAANRLRAFVESRANIPPADIPAARTDGHFLLDCLDDDDPAVRTAARRALEKQLGHPIEFDLRSGGRYRTLAVETLRKKYENQFRPTTAPAPKPAAESERPAAHE